MFSGSYDCDPATQCPLHTCQTISWSLSKPGCVVLEEYRGLNVSTTIYFRIRFSVRPYGEVDETIIFY